MIDIKALDHALRQQVKHHRVWGIPSRPPRRAAMNVKWKRRLLWIILCCCILAFISCVALIILLSKMGRTEAMVASMVAALTADCLGMICFEEIRKIPSAKAIKYDYYNGEQL